MSNRTRTSGGEMKIRHRRSEVGGQRSEANPRRFDAGCRSALTGRVELPGWLGGHRLTSDIRSLTSGSAFRPLPSGFTLLEVIVACGIFFMVAFAVLEVVTQGLSAARQLEQREPDAGLLAAALSLTNQLADGDSASGNFEDLASG